ncbi:MAG TPA: hypothetical protein VME70_15560 [Mycobacteriales bacterium]|nr:hypothetical protein [Mycobacteriales bacterium]
MNPVLADFLERIGWTSGQVFISVLLAGTAGAAVVGLPWKLAAVMAVSAAVATIVTTAVQYLAKQTDLPFWQDILVRAVKTFIASLAGSIAAAHPFNVVTFHWSDAFNVAAVAVLGSLGKGLLAKGDAGVPAGAAPAPAAVNPSTLSVPTYRAAIVR